MSKLRVISDCHGCIDNRNRLPNLPSYIELCEELGVEDYSVQIGDMGFDYEPLSKINPIQHRFFYGNHDNLDTYYNCLNSLGDFGLVNLGPFEFFFVRGAFSLDKKYRIANESITGVKSWWKNEELSQVEGNKCFNLYERLLPKVVMSHDCPAIISNMIGNPDFVQAFGYPRDMTSSTQHLLQQMFDFHQPRLWIFGHYHRNWTLVYKNTRFICIAEREYIDFSESWRIIGRT
jgi:hypothetical protein